jgi:hypothetical protein
LRSKSVAVASLRARRIRSRYAASFVVFAFLAQSLHAERRVQKHAGAERLALLEGQLEQLQRSLESKVANLLRPLRDLIVDADGVGTLSMFMMDKAGIDQRRCVRSVDGARARVVAI